MLRRGERGIEDKGQKVEDVFVGSDGRRISRAELEDPRTPGFTVPGRHFSSAEGLAAWTFGLRAADGRTFANFAPVEVAPDGTRVSRSEVPAPLREAAAAAWSRLEAIRARIAAALEKRTQAENAHRRAAARADKSAYNAAISAEMQAEEERKSLEAEEPPLRQKVSRAEEAIARWCRDESLYRTGAVPREVPVVF